MTEISFTSTLRPVNLAEFGKVMTRIGAKNSVDYPWTLKESVLANDVYTRGVVDCSACLISDGQNALLMHLTPDKEENHIFDSLVSFVKNKISLNNLDLQAVLIGSKDTKESLNVYDNFKKLLNQFGIPFSELKNGENTTHIAYKSSTDEVIVSNLAIEKSLTSGENNKQALESGFETIRIADCDEIL